MPRRAGQSSINAGPLDTIRDELGIGGSRNAGSGYEPEKVCTHCLGMLQGVCCLRGGMRFVAE
jgi:hypothetical protein